MIWALIVVLLMVILVIRLGMRLASLKTNMAGMVKKDFKTRPGRHLQQFNIKLVVLQTSPALLGSMVPSLSLNMY
jgi:hypothetical protein